MKSNFEKELEVLINRYSKENDSSTPDFILAKYLVNCLENFNTAVLERERWYGRKSTEDTQLKIPEFQPLIGDEKTSEHLNNVFIGYDNGTSNGNSSTFIGRPARQKKTFNSEMLEAFNELEMRKNMLTHSIEKLRKKYGLGEYKYSE